MTRTRAAKVLAAVLAASTLASCGESILDAAEQREQRREGKQRAERRTVERRGEPAVQERTAPGSKQLTGGKHLGGGQPTGGTSEASGTMGDGRGRRAAPPADGAGQGSPPEPGRPPQPAVSCSDDMTGDLDSSGSAPSYADLRSGCLREEGQQVALEATTVGAVPARMPDPDTHLAITFVLERAAGATVYVTAEATDQGWTATLNQGRRELDLPAPSVAGDSLRLTMPAAELGPGAIEWHYESSWLRSTLTSTAYAFDDAPNGGGGVPFDRG